MEGTCSNCKYYGVQLIRNVRRQMARAQCSLTLRRVNSLMTGCSLHRSEQDQVAIQQEWDETWRSGASVSLAVTQ